MPNKGVVRMMTSKRILKQPEDPIAFHREDPIAFRKKILKMPEEQIAKAHFISMGQPLRPEAAKIRDGRTFPRPTEVKAPILIRY